jgi:hypothetical protein
MPNLSYAARFKLSKALTYLQTHIPHPTITQDEAEMSDRIGYNRRNLLSDDRYNHAPRKA